MVGSVPHDLGEEDPFYNLYVSYQSQLSALGQVRSSLRELDTAARQIELQSQELRQRADELGKQAQTARSKGADDIAGRLLEQGTAIGQQIEQLERQIPLLAAQQQGLVSSAERLQAHVEQFRTQRELLKASYVGAQAQTLIDATADVPSAIDRPAASVVFVECRDDPRSDRP